MLCKKDTGETILTDVKLADTAPTRMKGLLGIDGLPKGEGLYIKPCTQIHTFFMRFAIDAAFLSKKGKVLHIRRHMPPWRLSRWVFGAEGVLEASAGAFDDTLKEGDTVVFCNG